MSAQVAEAIAADPRVALIEEDAIVGTSVSLPDFRQWNLDRADETASIMNSSGIYTGNRQYNYVTSGNQVYVYVVDAGVYAAHPEFKAGQVVSGPNFSDDGHSATNPCGGDMPPPTENQPEAIGSHGTAVASVIGGQTVGIAPNVTIVPIKVMGCFGQGRLLWWCWGVDWIAAPWQGDIQTGNPYPKAGSITSMSIFVESTAPFDTATPLTSLENAVNNAISSGVTVVVSANNQSNSGCTTVPARMGYGNVAYISPFRVITVGGTDEKDRLWKCADWNDCTISGNTGSNTGPCVDIYAPAHDVKVAFPGRLGEGEPQYRRTGGWSSGTSFAAPYVAGLAARIQERYGRTLAPESVWNLVQGSSCPLGPDFDGDGVSANDIFARMAGNQ